MPTPYFKVDAVMCSLLHQCLQICYFKLRQCFLIEQIKYRETLLKWDKKNGETREPQRPCWRRTN